MKRLTVLVAGVATVMTLGAGLGQAGPTPVACGQVITRNTHVRNDLLNCPGDGLVIGANNVKLDLGHHVIDGDGVNAATDDGVDNTGGFDNVKIEHGTIQQFQQGVHLVGATMNKLEHLTVIQTFRGIELETASNDNKIEHNKAHDNATWGITQDASNNNTYKHNKIFRNNTAGFGPFNSTGLRFEHNDLKQNKIGIELFNTDASFFSHNKIRSSTLDGIHSSAGSTGNLFKKNDAKRNGDDGIDIADPGNTITKNHADRNVDLGIFAAAGNIDGGKNKAHHNGNPAQCVGVSCH